MRTDDIRVLSGPTIMMIAGLAGLLTWLCTNFFGDQSLLTAIIAVVLVELLLASFGVIAILLTERVTVELLNAENRKSAPPKPRLQPTPLWLRVPDPHPQDLSVADSQYEPETSTIAFPDPVDHSRSDTPDQFLPAA